LWRSDILTFDFLTLDFLTNRWKHDNLVNLREIEQWLTIYTKTKTCLQMYKISTMIARQRQLNRTIFWLPGEKTTARGEGVWYNYLVKGWATLFVEFWYQNMVFMIHWLLDIGLTDILTLYHSDIMTFDLLGLYFLTNR